MASFFTSIFNLPFTPQPSSSSSSPPQPLTSPRLTSPRPLSSRPDSSVSTTHLSLEEEVLSQTDVSEHSTVQENNGNEEKQLERKRSQSTASKTKFFAKQNFRKSSKTDYAQEAVVSPGGDKTQQIDSLTDAISSRSTSTPAPFHRGISERASFKTDVSEKSNTSEIDSDEQKTKGQKRQLPRRYKNRLASRTDFPVTSTEDKNEKSHKSVGESKTGVHSEFKTSLTEWFGLEVSPLVYLNDPLRYIQQLLLIAEYKQNESIIHLKLYSLKQLSRVLKIVLTSNYLHERKKANSMAIKCLNKGGSDYDKLASSIDKLIKNLKSCLPIDDRNKIHDDQYLKFLKNEIQEKERELKFFEDLKFITKYFKDFNTLDDAIIFFDEHLEYLILVRNAYSCEDEKNKVIELLKRENEVIESLLDYQNEKWEDSCKSFKGELESSLCGLWQKKREMYNSSGFKVSPLIHLQEIVKQLLDESRMPDFPKDVDSTKRREFELVMVEIARQALALSNEGVFNDAKEVEGGSGGVYFIYNKPSCDKTRKPMFVFKPYDEAPGMPGNKKDNTPVKLNVCGDRSLHASRIAFPVSEGILREYAVALLFPFAAPRRTLATLKLSSNSDEYKSGLLMEYIPHVYTLAELAEAVAYEQCQAEFEGNASQIRKVLSNPELDKKIREEQAVKLTKQRQRIEAKRVCLKVNQEKTEVQSKAIDLCKGWKSKISQLPIWKYVATDSVEELLLYSLEVPDLDRNADNIFLVEDSNPKEQGKPYKLVMIDADQAFPDTWKWQTVNPPVWLDSIAGEMVLSQSIKLTQAIQRIDARKMLSQLKDFGITFQNNPKEIFDSERRETVVVGGDVFNILNAFHITAKIGLANHNTANQVGRLLFQTQGEDKILYNIYLKAKNHADQQSLLKNPEYEALVKTELYQNSLNNVSYSAEDEILWKNFEILVLQELNRTKAKAVQNVDKKEKQ